MEENLYNIIDDDRKVLKLPRILEHHQEHNEKLLVGELGSIHKYKNVISDFSLNIVNSYAVAFLHSLGVERVTLSYELNDYQIEKLINNYKERYNTHPNLELIVAGKIEAMIMKYKLLSNYKLKDKAIIQDRYNNKFEVKEKNNLTYIYHFETLNKKCYQKYFNLGINYIRF